MFPVKLGSNPLVDHFLLLPGIHSDSKQINHGSVRDLDHPSDRRDIKKGSRKIDRVLGSKPECHDIIYELLVLSLRLD